MATPAAPFTQEQVIQTIQTMYAPGAGQAEATKWLERIGASPHAWELADKLLYLDGQSETVYFFAAKTLRTKIQNDYDELPDESVGPLRESLVRLIQRHRTNATSVLTQLALALADLAVLMPSWLGIVPSLVTCFSGSADDLRPLLLILQLLPEEAISVKLSVPNERQVALENDLTQSFGQVIKVLEGVQTQFGADADVQTHICHCIRSWIVFHGTPADALAASPLLPWLLQGIDSPALFDDATDAFVEIIRFAGENHTSHPALSAFVIPNTLQMAHKWGPIAEAEHDDFARGYCEIFTTLAESYMDVILSEGTAECMEALRCVLLATAYPDIEVHSITYKFWGEFSDAVGQLKEERRPQFAPAFQQLVVVALGLLRFPEELPTGSHLEDFRDARRQIGELIKDACRVLYGPAALRLISEHMNQGWNAFAANAADWRPLESCLFAIRAMAVFVSAEESHIMPGVMTALCQIGSLPLETVHSLLLRTDLLVMGMYAAWIRKHPECLPSLLTVIWKCIPRPDVGRIAAGALHDIADHCRQHLVQQLPHVIQLLSEPLDHLTTTDKVELMETAAGIASAQDPAVVGDSLAAIGQPALDVIKQMLTAGATKDERVVRTLCVSLDQVTAIFERVRSTDRSREHPALKLLNNVWPLIGQAFTIHSDTEILMEKCCRACKYILRSMKTEFEPVLTPMLETLLASYTSRPFSCYLHLVAVSISTFSKKRELWNHFSVTINRLIEITMGYLATAERYTQSPDIVEDFFNLLSRVCSAAPPIAIESPHLEAAVQGAISGLQVQQAEAAEAVLAFLENLVYLASALGAEADPYATMCQAKINPIMAQTGLVLIQKLLAAAAGVMPLSRLPDIAGVFSAVLEVYPAELRVWIEQGLSSLEAHVQAKVAKNNFVEIMTDPRRSPGEREAALGMFRKLCTRHAVV